MDLKEIKEDQYDFYIKEARKLSKFMSSILNGNKSNDTFIKAYTMHTNKSQYLFNDNIKYLLNYAINNKTMLLSSLNLIEKYHTINEPRVRQIINMDPHHVYINPNNNNNNDECPLLQCKNPENTIKIKEFGCIGINKPPMKGKYTIKQIKGKMVKVFDYDKFNLLTEKLSFSDVGKYEEYLPSYLVKKWLSDNLSKYYGTLKDAFKDIPYDDPIKSSNVKLPEDLMKSIQPLINKGCKEAVLMQEINRLINLKGFIKKYQDLQLKKVNEILDENCDIIYNNKIDIIGEDENEQIKPIMQQMIEESPTITNITIFRLMKVKILEMDKELSKKNKLKKNNDKNKNDDVIIEEEIESDIDVGALGDIMENSDNSNYNSEKENIINEKKDDNYENNNKICSICEYPLPPSCVCTEIPNESSQIWLMCMSCKQWIHFECSDKKKPTKSRKIRKCPAC